MMNIVVFESFKVDIKKTGKQNVCFCPRDSIKFQSYLMYLDNIE